MNQSVFSPLIRKFRLTSGLSQADVARLLGVRQATVSRIESGRMLPSPELAEKIKNLPMKGPVRRELPSPAKLRVRQEMKTIKANGFSVTYIGLSLEEQSGDYCSVDQLTSNKLSFVLADTVGHGINASGMSFAIEFGYKVVLSVINPSLIQASVLEAGIRGAISKTQKSWMGPPSLISGTFDVTSGLMEFVNSGQPIPYMFKDGNVREVRPQANRVLTSMAGYWEPQIQDTLVEMIEPGDAILLFSDGFAELVPYLHKQQSDIKSRFLRAAKLLRGDSEAILMNVLNLSGTSHEVEPDSFSDDATALLIARKRKS